VPDAEARAVFDWLKAKGMKFHFGTDEATELTETQVLWQCKTYVAALRIADEFGCEIDWYPIPARSQGSPARQRPG